ncbi:P-loop containing nucleoside triphosphate hydrolase protein [Diaporthe sp. PMI_573]|nr:P-loop containing nucleoside triphosphate hydrolase protein [Diaporthaceae sp. PMI_573]
MKFIEVRVRPVPSPSDKSGGGEKTLKGASRIYVNKEVLLELTGTALENGKRCFVEKTLDDGKATTREASLWAAADPKVSRGIVQMSKPFQDACDVKLGDQVKVIYTDGGAVPDAEEVVLEDVTTGQPAIDKEDLVFWEWTLKLMGLDDVFPGFLVKRVPAGAVFRNFKITSVNGSTSGNARFVAASTKIRIGTAQDPETAVPIARPAFIKLDAIPGLEPQVRELNKKLRRWGPPRGSLCSRPSCGLVLNGGRGTGKTMLVEKICESGWGTVHRIRPRDKLSFIAQTFQTAKENQPSIVVMDGFESIINNDRSNRTAVIDTLVEFLDKLASEAIAELPKVLVLATCMDYTTNMPQELREDTYFDAHFNLPLPDPARRKAILSSFHMPLSPDTGDSILHNVSEKTHAYNGKDLKALRSQVAEMLFERLGDIEDSGMTASPDDYFITEEMLTRAMKDVPPSAMHDISLKPPPVHWDDIGGQQEVKAALQEALDLAKTPRDIIKDLMSTPPKGFLLYGPPGCSKTMVAQALATEGDLNFFAVKGAELLNMYVGESERQVRQLFQRAREAAPSVIFFDEIDSISGSRSGFGSTKSGGGGGNSGLNVLTTLLNEMQGFEVLQDVLILAATNRPQAMDPALLRPGRFDRLIYVGPPEEAARAAIFRKWLAGKRGMENIDVEELARDSEGFSGAETVAICDAVGMAAFRRYCKSGKDERPGITMVDFREQIGKRPRMITTEMLEAYEVWRNKFLKETQFA